MIDDPREAPWYGPWNIVLQDLFQDFCPPPFCTTTYPHVEDIDVVDFEEEESDNEMDDQVGLYPLP
jgi:hypothetical protein